jgi:hypothetical protein
MTAAQSISGEQDRLTFEVDPAKRRINGRYGESFPKLAMERRPERSGCYLKPDSPSTDLARCKL